MGHTLNLWNRRAKSIFNNRRITHRTFASDLSVQAAVRGTAGIFSQLGHYNSRFVWTWFSSRLDVFHGHWSIWEMSDLPWWPLRVNWHRSFKSIRYKPRSVSFRGISFWNNLLDMVFRPVSITACNVLKRAFERRNGVDPELLQFSNAVDHSVKPRVLPCSPGWLGFRNEIAHCKHIDIPYVECQDVNSVSGTLQDHYRWPSLMHLSQPHHIGTMGSKQSFMAIWRFDLMYVWHRDTTASHLWLFDTSHKITPGDFTKTVGSTLEVWGLHLHWNIGFRSKNF